MILLSSGNQLLCFAEIKHLQRLLTAINGKLLLLPICQLERYVALKVALVHSCLRQYLSKKDTHTHFRHAFFYILKFSTIKYVHAKQFDIP